jgi:hypothetical protein
MITHGVRMITVKKLDLIEKVKKNKTVHLKEYKNAVKSYKALAIGELNKLSEKTELERLRSISDMKNAHAKQLASLKRTLKVNQVETEKRIDAEIEKVDNGQMFTNMVATETPTDNSEKYDSIVNLFEWDVLKEVELNQTEFSEWVNDKTTWAEVSRAANMGVVTQAFANTTSGHSDVNWKGLK